MKRTSVISKFILALSIALVINGASTTIQAEDRITASVKTMPSGQALSGAEQQSLSFSAERILKYVDQPRQALAKKDRNTALAQVEKGLSLAKLIEQTVPTVLVKATMKAGTMQYQDEDHVKRLVVPSYQ